MTIKWMRRNNKLVPKGLYSDEIKHIVLIIKSYDKKIRMTTTYTLFFNTVRQAKECATNVAKDRYKDCDFCIGTVDYVSKLKPISKLEDKEREAYNV